MDPSFRCRILPHAELDGPANMARDAAMLERVIRDPVAALFRTYGWTEGTLSLGYFQPHAAVAADPRFRDAPVVRRPTGGGAIWHDREVTYALALPCAHPLARRSETLYQAVHAAIAAMIRSKGHDARPRGPTAPRAPDSARPLLCFNDRDAHDLMLGGFKVVGSAQRRKGGGFLQHGSILLGRSGRTPELPGLADLVHVSDDRAAWADALETHLPNLVGVPTRCDCWDDELVAVARHLEESVYRTAAWNQRR